MSTPRFQHDCTKCQFLGNGIFQKKPVDWYTCDSREGLRTVIARYGSEGPQYASTTIGETVTPSPVVMAALAQGLELTQTEKDKLLKALLSQHRQGMGIAFWAACMDPDSEDHNQIGPANWLDLNPIA